jgi:hypothetical protein
MILAPLPSRIGRFEEAIESPRDDAFRNRLGVQHVFKHDAELREKARTLIVSISETARQALVGRAFRE